MHAQQQQYTSAYNTPMAGWLAKMTPLPFGKSRWQDRFFVLLDTELRYYKDEVSSNKCHKYALCDHGCC